MSKKKKLEQERIAAEKAAEKQRLEDMHAEMRVMQFRMDHGTDIILEKEYNESIEKIEDDNGNEKVDCSTSASFVIKFIADSKTIKEVVLLEGVEDTNVYSISPIQGKENEYSVIIGNDIYAFNKETLDYECILRGEYFVPSREDEAQMKEIADEVISEETEEDCCCEKCKNESTESTAEQPGAFRKKQIYLANGLFCEADRLYNEKIASEINALGKYKVYVPQNNKKVNDKKKTADSQAIYMADTKELMKSDILIAVLDGQSIDEGVAAEIGFMAGAIQYGCSPKIILGLSTDIRDASLTASTEKNKASASGLCESQYSYKNLYTIGAIKATGGKIFGSVKELIKFLKDRA